MRLETIVVGYDGSTNARSALEAAMSLLSPGGVVHVVVAYHEPTTTELAEIMQTLPEEYKTGLDLMAGPRGHLRDALRLLESKGLTGEAHFVEDRPAKAILDTADRVAADLIVVGSRGLGRATRLFRGSVSTRIASHATTSFMVINEPDD